MEERWFPLSYELFKDEGEFKGEFFGGCDINDEGLFGEGSIHRHRYDMIYIGYFVHLFPPHRQAEIVNNLVQMLKPVAGSMMFGNTAGTAKENGHRMKADFAPPVKNEKGELERPDFVFHSTKTVVELLSKAVEGKQDGEWEFMAGNATFDTDTSPTKAFAQHFKDAEILEVNFCMRRK